MKTCRCYNENNIICERKATSPNIFELNTLHVDNIRYMDLKNFDKITGVYRNTYLVYLKVENCKITNVKKIFSTPNLVYLNITKNKISRLFDYPNSEIYLLQTLDISYNPIKNISFLSRLNNLKVLDISYTKVEKMSSNLKKGLKKLHVLKIRGCDINSVDSNIFLSYELKIFDLSMSNIPPTYRLKLVDRQKKIESFKSKYFSLCCYLWKKIKSVECFPSKSIFQSCTDLLGSNFLKFLIWICSFLSILLNSIAIIINVLKTNPTSSIIYLSLSTSDFGVGLYLLSISIANSYYEGKFFEHEEIWTSSSLCLVIGCLMNFSIINSSLSVFSISFQKYLILKYPMENFSSKKKTTIATLIILIISCIFASLPNFLYDVIKKKISRIN